MGTRLEKKFAAIGVLGVLAGFCIPSPSRAQSEPASDAPGTLTALLTAACKRNETQFAAYLTVENAAAFRALPDDQRTAVLRRLSLTENPGRPLLSNDAQGRTILRCEAPGATSEFKFGPLRARENLAFIPVIGSAGETAEFGLVREAGGWKLLSVGLMLFDIPQLSVRWAEEELQNREQEAVGGLRGLATAIATYRDAFEKLPDSIAQLGPAPKNEVSPDQANLITREIASGSQDGYRFRYRLVGGADSAPSGYEIAATPEAYAKSGRRSFFLDSAGKIHGADRHGQPATAEDPVVPEVPHE